MEFLKDVSFWKISTFVILAVACVVVIFLLQKYNNLRTKYENDTEKYRAQANGEVKKLNSAVNDIIMNLIALLNIYSRWRRTKRPDQKLEYEVVLDKLPIELREKINLKKLG